MKCRQIHISCGISYVEGVANATAPRIGDTAAGVFEIFRQLKSLTLEEKELQFSSVLIKRI